MKWKDRDWNLFNLMKKPKKKLRKGIPEEGSVNNPIDVLGDAPVQRYKETLDIVLKR